MARRIRTVTFLLGGLLAAWSDPASAQLQGQVIRIGIGAPLTGGAASFGVEMKQAVELAIEEQNTIGGRRFEAAVADDEGTDAKGQTVARAFCDDQTILGIVGHVNSNVSITASTI